MPDRVAEACRAEARRYGAAVMCPTRWPAGFRGPFRRVADYGRSSTYLLDVEGAGIHVMLGGSARGITLAGAPGERWIRPHQALPAVALRLPDRRRATPIRGGGTFVQELPSHVVRRASVHGRPALVLRAPPYPRGGIQGGHVIVVWNEGGRGYSVSLHFPGRDVSLARRTATVLALARSAG